MKTPLSSTDASFFRLDSQFNHQAIGLFCPLSTLPNLSLLKQRIYNLPTIFPKMGSKVEKHGKLLWVTDKNFDPSNHFEIMHAANILDQESFFKEVSKQFSKHLDLSKPLWRFSIITNQLNPSPNQKLFCALLFCAHHALVDGLRGIEIFNTLTDNHSDISKKSQSSGNYKINIFSSFKRILFESLSPPLKSFLNGINSNERSLITFDLPIDKIKLIKKENNVSFNDVLLTITTTALTNYFVATNHQLQDLRALIPFNIQRTKNKDLGNHLGGIALSLPITQQNTRTQLLTIHSQTGHLKRTGAFGAYTLLGKLVSSLPPSIYSKLARYQFSRTNFICSSVQGHKTEQTIAGARVLGAYGIPALLYYHGLALCFITYTNKVCVTVITDPHIISSPEIIARLLQKGLEQLIHSEKDFTQSKEIIAF